MSSWLVKSESSVYSIDRLKRDGITAWDGVRNYQARNNLKAMKRGDQVLFYHSSNEPLGIVGLATVVREAYPDELQFDRKSDYYDPKATQDKPTWFSPDLKFAGKFSAPLELARLRADRRLAGMALLQKGSRLSVQPVSDKHLNYILEMAGPLEK